MTGIALLGLLAVLASALCSGLEIGLYCTSRLRVVLDAAAGHPAARRLQSLLAELPLVLTVLLIGNNVAHWAASFLAQLALDRAGVRGAEALGTVAVTVVLFVFGESVPKSAFRARQHGLVYPFTPVLYALRVALGWLAWPVHRLAQGLARKMMPRSGPGAPAAGEREVLLAAGAAEGLLTGFQQRVAKGVLAMRSRTAGDEARSVDVHPVAKLGLPGVVLPPGCREHRVLVLDESGTQLAGWVPLAALAAGTGFRAPERRELRSVARLEAGTSLDRVYLTLDRTGAPFGVIGHEPPLRVVDGRLLRQRVMGAPELQA